MVVVMMVVVTTTVVAVVMVMVVVTVAKVQNELRLLHRRIPLDRGRQQLRLDVRRR